VERLDEGEIYFKGDRIDHLPPHKIARRGIGRTFQLIRVFPELTALENLLVVARQDWEPAYRRALELLIFVKLDQLRGEFAGNLSYGQQRLLEFARVLMIDPDLVLLDEPAAGINRSLLNDLLNAIRDLRTGGKTVLIVEHDMKVVMDLSEKIFVLDHGEKLTEGTPETVLKDERVLEAYFGR
jgi:branched-chain amino acid transport system ATP-binding protein